MNLSSLTAISPIDGRYRKKVASLGQYYSEFALIKYRVHVEVEYFIRLCEMPLPQLSAVDTKVFPQLRAIASRFSTDDAQQIKDIEKTTNHDVKAVEYFLKNKFDEIGLGAYKEFIHFALTSQDINNTATPLSLRDAFFKEYQPLLKKVMNLLYDFGKEWEHIPMLAKTHGQPASPTLLGKEFMVFWDRLSVQHDLLEIIPFSAKFGGATGNMNAHYVSYPDVAWHDFADEFVKDLGLERSLYTTQIEAYDNMGALFDNIKRINTILLDLAKDVWQYVSMNYFKQKIKAGEVGSSTMPHKVNPIDFENAEGNLGLANALFSHLSQKLPISRLQRDLTDSTVLRNIGVPMAHTQIALLSLLKGLNKLMLNQAAINADLEANWAVVAEAIQTILRRENYPAPYEALKKLTRKNTVINETVIHQFVDGLDISEAVKAELKKITPYNYTGRTYDLL
ncbi:MAG: adenylosuccinate lyase [Chitinophagales bacterium]